MVSEVEDINKIVQQNTSEKEKKRNGCQHYKRNCSIIAPCCDIEYSCWLCHDSNFGFKSQCQVDTMDRKALQKIKCLECQAVQGISNECNNCHIWFAQYFCSICKLWQDDQRKQIFHCDQCGICWVGKREEVQHCNKCNFCYLQGSFEGHSCKESLKDDYCCICYKDFHSSTDPVSAFGSCGHFLHRKCLNKYIQTNINCPLCGQSYAKEDEEQIKYVDNRVEQTKDLFLDAPCFNIWCHNCRKETKEVKFNYYGMKCGECGSYNTKMV